jgi:hypothetical protein
MCVGETGNLCIYNVTNFGQQYIIIHHYIFVLRVFKWIFVLVNI